VDKDTQTTPRTARLLDVTRLLRRAGRVWTGVDRVELAYLETLLSGPVPVWGLARTPLGYVLLDRAGLNEWYKRLTGALPFCAPDLVSRLSRGQTKIMRCAQSEARKRAVARCAPRGLAAMLRRCLPHGTAYLNTGHSNLSQRVLSAVRSLPEAQITVFVHDVIPLEYPHYQRAGTVGVFEAKMQRVRRHADLILYNSDDTRRRTEVAMAVWGDVPRGIVAHLGTMQPVPDPAALPAGLPPEGPYFITTGTIEPRKNHALLLDVWDALGPDAPMLLICGGRGWNNAAVFDRLDALAPDARVREIKGLSDGALAALTQGAQAMLFPSHAEGFGLPAIEALSLGTPVMCSNIATFREILAENAVYLDATDTDLWKKEIVHWSKRPRDTLRVGNFEAPTWVAHFKIALSYT